MRVKLLIFGIEFLALLAASLTVQVLNPESLWGPAIFMFGVVFLIGFNGIILLLALRKR